MEPGYLFGWYSKALDMEENESLGIIKDNIDGYKAIKQDAIDFY